MTTISWFVGSGTGSDSPTPSWKPGIGFCGDKSPSEESPGSLPIQGTRSRTFLFDLCGCSWLLFPFLFGP